MPTPLPVFITGASRGIGAAAARHFAREGHPVALIARNATLLESVAASIAAAGGKALAIACDVAEEAEMKQALRCAKDAFGGVGIVINNAGTLEPIAPIVEADLAAWARAMAVNLIAPVIVMHNRESADAAIDIVGDVIDFLSRSLEVAARAGIARENIVLDPGIGFGKTPEQSITCIARLAELKRFGLPLLVGASRKRFISTVTPSAPDERIGGSISAHLLAVEKGAAIIRAHDVAETVQALRVAAAIEAAR